MQAIDFGSNESFINNYQHLKSAEEMGKLYKCSKTTILNHAKKIGLNLNETIERQYKLSP